LDDLYKNTAAVPNDFDMKALQLLDAFNTAGRAKAAIAHLKESLHEIPREKIGNWRAYVFVLLRKYDQELYNSMRVQRGRPAARPPKEGAAKTGYPAKETVSLNANAAEFIPGKTWLADPNAAAAPEASASSA